MTLGLLASQAMRRRRLFRRGGAGRSVAALGHVVLVQTLTDAGRLPCSTAWLFGDVTRIEPTM